MVTTRAGYAKKLLGAELDDDDGDNHGMYLEDLFDDETNHGLSLEDIQERAIEQALMQCANPSGAKHTNTIGKISALKKTAEKREGTIVTLRYVELIANTIR